MSAPAPERPRVVRRSGGPPPTSKPFRLASSRRRVHVIVLVFEANPRSRRLW